MKKLSKSIGSILLALIMAVSFIACQKSTERLESLAVEPLYWPVGVPLPEASAFVKDLPEDVSVRYMEEYHFADVGVYPLSIILTDKTTGAELERTVQFSLLVDVTPPIISGVKEISATLGKPVSYKNGITVSDNCSTEINLSIDNSKVDLSKEGSYPVTYIAVDAVGNTTTVETVLHVYAMEITQAMLYEKIDPVISKIINAGMSLEAKCRAVYQFVYQNVKYVSDSDKSDWVRAAYCGIDEGQGDCYTYFALSKAFFERLGIENMCIQRTANASNILGETHYWNYVNIGTAQNPQWYHFDTTHLRDPNYTGKLVLLTEQQLQYYNKFIRTDNGYFYDYDHTGYPISAETIINPIIVIS